MILKAYHVGELSTNNYLLIDEISKEAVLIDCTGDFEIINNDLQKYGANLKYILLTHGHFDHILGCPDFKKNLSPKICVNERDKILLENVKLQCDYFGMSKDAKIDADMLIDETTNLKVGNHEIKVIETKGHTKGGISYLIDGMLFAGDTLFFEEIGRCDLPGGDFNEIKDSIAKKLYKLPQKTPVYPGHGRPTTIEHEMEFNYYVNGNSIV